MSMWQIIDHDSRRLAEPPAGDQMLPPRLSERVLERWPSSLDTFFENETMRDLRERCQSMADAAGYVVRWG